jgi:hypothetical protein
MKPKLLLGSAISLIAACGPSAEEKSKRMIAESENRFEQAMQDSVLSAAPSYLISEHTLKGKTKQLVKGVEFLEMYTKHQKGYVEKSEIRREDLGQKEMRISRDTTAIISNYRLVADLTLRIPYYAMDSTMLLCRSMMEYVDFRGITNINAETDLIGHTLDQASNEKLIENDQKTSKQNTIKPSIEMAKQEKSEAHLMAANNARIAKLKLQENILFGTLHVSLYEDEKNQIEKSLLLEEIRPYEPNIFIKIGNSLKEGAKGLETMVLFLSSIWAWILAGWLSYKAYYHWRKNLKGFGSNK